MAMFDFCTLCPLPSTCTCTTPPTPSPLTAYDLTFVVYNPTIPFSFLFATLTFVPFIIAFSSGALLYSSRQYRHIILVLVVLFSTGLNGLIKVLVKDPRP